MDEDCLKASLETYKSQLAQVEQAIQAAGATEDLIKLKGDLKEVLELTEASLLSLAKSKLLSSLENENGIPENVVPSSSEPGMDAEMAAFKQAIGEGTVSHHNEEETSAKGDDSVAGTAPSHSGLEDIVGTKCRAPYTQEWGTMEYHNALVLNVETIQSPPAVPMVRVVFCNPTHQSMVPCQYYMDGSCKFSDQDCRFSHGHPVRIEDLQEFLKPDYSLLCLGSPCLARYTDRVWYRGIVVDVLDDHQYVVQYDTYDDTRELGLEDLVPTATIERRGDSSSGASDSEGEDATRPEVKGQIDRDSDDEDELPVFLWKPPKTNDALGQWEVHTKGFGSRLMAKMGYVTGQGLGKDGSGRAEPVPIQLLPTGKSLDKIMELKEIAGDRDLYDVMKRQEKKQKKQAKKSEAGYKAQSSKSDVFDFLNHRLGSKKGHSSGVANRHGNLSSSKQQPRHISEQELHKKSDRHLNIQLLKTNEEMKKTEQEIVRLKQALARNELRGDKGAAGKISLKIESMKRYIDRLRTSEKTMQSHQKRRTDHKKLTIF